MTPFPISMLDDTSVLSALASLRSEVMNFYFIQQYLQFFYNLYICNYVVVFYIKLHDYFCKYMKITDLLHCFGVWEGQATEILITCQCDQNSNWHSSN